MIERVAAAACETHHRVEIDLRDRRDRSVSCIGDGIEKMPSTDCTMSHWLPLSRLGCGRASQCA
jgi:hypothetical protein